MTDKAAIDGLAHHFAAVLTEWLTPIQLADVRRLNRTAYYKRINACATHDFCDANMAMSEAFERQFNRDCFIGCGDAALEAADMELWNAAWEVASAREFQLEPAC